MEMKDRKKATETAESRMQMIAPLLAPNLSREDVTKLKESISEQFQVSVRTVERYSKSYLEHGFEGLYPQGRSTESKFNLISRIKLYIDIFQKRKCHNFLHIR